MFLVLLAEVLAIPPRFRETIAENPIRTESPARRIITGRFRIYLNPPNVYYSLTLFCVLGLGSRSRRRSPPGETASLATADHPATVKLRPSSVQPGTSIADSTGPAMRRMESEGAPAFHLRWKGPDSFALLHKLRMFRSQSAMSTRPTLEQPALPLLRPARTDFFPGIEQ